MCAGLRGIWVGKIDPQVDVLEVITTSGIRGLQSGWNAVGARHANVQVEVFFRHFAGAAVDDSPVPCECNSSD
jgi:hypothetical protein